MSEEHREEGGEEARLLWKRGRFVVRQHVLGLSVPRLQEVRGVVAGPFGIYKSIDCFELVHTPTGCVLTDLAKQKQCRELAGDLLRLRIRWDAADPDQVRGEDTPILQQTIRRHREAAFPRMDMYSR
jgi:hypothetical protein